MPYDVTLIPGDGIGPEVTKEAITVLQTVAAIHGYRFDFEEHAVGGVAIKHFGSPLPRTTLDACLTSDAVLLGAMGHPDVRKPDGTEVAPQVTLREILDLYAGVRPCKLYPGARTPLSGAVICTG